MLLKCIRVIASFFDPRHFWMIYLCYVLFFLHGLIGGSFLDPVFITLSGWNVLGFIQGVSLLTSLAVMCVFYALYLGFKKYQTKDFLFCFYIVHSFFVVFFAPTMALWGLLQAWGSR